MALIANGHDIGQCETMQQCVLILDRADSFGLYLFIQTAAINIANHYWLMMLCIKRQEELDEWTTTYKGGDSKLICERVTSRETGFTIFIDPLATRAAEDRASWQNGVTTHASQVVGRPLLGRSLYNAHA